MRFSSSPVSSIVDWSLRFEAVFIVRLPAGVASATALARGHSPWWTC